MAAGHTSLAADNSAVPRKERRRLEVRGRILEASRELFGELGYRDTRVVEICERADVAKKTFFNHFPSKQDVLKELAQAVIDEVVVEIEQAREDGASTRERLALVFARLTGNISAGGPMSRELSAELAHALQEAGEEGRQAQRLHHALGAIVRDGVELGDVTSSHDVDLLTDVVIGVYYQLILNWVHDGDYPVARRAAAAASFLAEALALAAKE